MTETTTAGTTTTTATTTAPWHQGVLDADLLGRAQNKGWAPADVKDLPSTFAKVLKSYVELENMRGIPAERILKLPEASAQPAELDAFWQRLGAAKEAKEIDWSGVKTAGGEAIDAKLTDKLTATALSSRAPKEVALAMGREVVKYLDDQAAEAKTIQAGKIAEQKALLEQSWPAATREANMFVAKQTLGKIGASAGLQPDQITAAWDAISKLGGVGAFHALEMLRTIGTRIGEGKFVQMNDGKGGQMPMTVEAARDEIETLMKDTEFQKRRQAGGAAETARWKALHKIAYNASAAA